MQDLINVSWSQNPAKKASGEEMTQEWTVNDQFFPFVCESCEKELEDHEIIRSAGSYGYVNLTNGEFTYIGLICPMCNHITLQKYRSNSIKTEMDDLFFAQQAYIAFMPDESIELFTKECNDLFLVPDKTPQLKAIDYPIDLIDQHSSKWPYNKFLYRISEDDLEVIINWENKNNRKILPRIISTISPYHKTECLISYLDDPESEYSNPISAEEIYLILFHLARDKYLYAEETTITEEIFNNLSIHFVVNRNYSYPDDFKNICTDILNEYFQKRSNFDFEQTWKKDFLDKYIKKLFYKKGYYRSDQYYKDKQEFEKIHGKVFKGPYKKIDESQQSEIMTCQKVVTQIGIEPIELSNYISSGDLPAYYGNHVYYDPQENVTQSAFIDPEKFLYLSSEVDELLWRHPELKHSVSTSPNENELSSEDKDAVEYEKVEYEKKKWDESLKAAVAIGFECAKNSPVFNVETLISSVDKIFPNLPVSSIETIWRSLPGNNRNGDIDCISGYLLERKNLERNHYKSAKSNDGVKRNIKNRRKKRKELLSSIKTAIDFSLYIFNEDKSMRNEDIDKMLQSMNKLLTTGAMMKIRDALPEKYRRGSGEYQRKKKDDEDFYALNE
ncbi:hypothetical protein DSCW_19760 [Desulfosarcina widdelii]|uniref:Uncharacterized protein n=1 Tax=Desulfosarcina widdelii TaxID=947919 RepID=A0A5K7Z2R5_9BACT|nr:hypothetical protein [Desulfosarcina widdelii]BBO74559.1 hypothetical protein DSCW_19760 [Desulfosarcina widdelii]